MAIVLACAHSKASPNPPAPPADTGQPVGDERQVHPINARAVVLTHDHGKLTFVIGFPKEVGPDVVHSDWTGMFTADDKEIPGSKFKLKMIVGAGARAEIAADELPSSTVRLFPPGYRGRF